MGIYTFRPCDGNETAGAYAVAVESRKTPSLFALSRQGLPNQAGSSAAHGQEGRYVIYGEAAGAPDCILIGTGSEVEICIEAAKALEGEGKKVRVVSMPCTELFDAQSAEYKESILPAACPSACRARQGPPSAGASTSATPGPPSVWTTSGPPLRPTSSTRSTASPRTPSSRPPRARCKIKPSS